MVNDDYMDADARARSRRAVERRAAVAAGGGVGLADRIEAGAVDRE